MNENYNGNMHWNKGRSPVISAAVGISCITMLFIFLADFPSWALLINPIRSENSLLFISDCRPFEGTQNKILPDLDLAGFSLQIIINSNSTNKVWFKKNWYWWANKTQKFDISKELTRVNWFSTSSKQN